jgi:hypothetical protein
MRVVTSMQVFESWILDACVWIYWIAHGNFHSRYTCLRFVYLRLFQRLWLATFLEVARGADLVSVNSKGERRIAVVTVNPWWQRWWKPMNPTTTSGKENGRIGLGGAHAGYVTCIGNYQATRFLHKIIPHHHVISIFKFLQCTSHLKQNKLHGLHSSRGGR